MNISTTKVLLCSLNHPNVCATTVKFGPFAKQIGYTADIFSSCSLKAFGGTPISITFSDCVILIVIQGIFLISHVADLFKCILHSYGFQLS